MAKLLGYHVRLTPYPNGLEQDRWAAEVTPTNSETGGCVMRDFNSKEDAQAEAEAWASAHARRMRQVKVYVYYPEEDS